MNLAKVGNKWIAYAADSPDLESGFSSADAVMDPSPKKARALPLVPLDEAAKHIAIAGCDPALQIIRAMLAQTAKLKVILHSSNSTNSLQLLQKGFVHAAGVHFHFQNLDGSPLFVEKTRYPVGSQVLRYSTWEQGWAILPNNPKKFRGIQDLTRKDVRLANREAGSGTRALLDHLLAKARIKSAQIPHFAETFHSHLSSTQEVAQGRADVSLSVRAIAASLGLHFLPVAQVSFDLIILREFIGHPSIQTLAQTLQSTAFHRNLDSLPGYSAKKSGTVQ